MFEEIIGNVVDFLMTNATPIIEVGVPAALTMIGIGIGGLLVAGMFTAIEWFDRQDYEEEEELTPAQKTVMARNDQDKLDRANARFREEMEVYGEEKRTLAEWYASTDEYGQSKEVILHDKY